MSLHTDHRPTKLKQFVGNDAVVESIKSVLSRKKGVPSTFLFSGPAGTGKTTLARIVKNELKCSDMDFIELNAADDRGIGAIRQLKESLKFTPLGGKKKVILLDEAHMLTKESKEALLKMLEEPPSYVHFCIATTNPEVFNATFKRRCHQYELSSLREAHIIKILDSVLEKEGVKKFPKKIKEQIIELADGSPGQALKLLDQVIDMTDVDRAIETLQSAGSTESDIKALCLALLNGEENKVKKWLKEFKGDAEAVRRPILGYLASVGINNWSEDTMKLADYFTTNYFDSGLAGLKLSCFFALKGD